MGLKRIGGNGSAYIHSTTTDGIITVFIVEKDNSYTTKINESSEGVVKWSRNLKKEPKEYVFDLNQALEGTAYDITKEGTKEVKEDTKVTKEGTEGEGGQDDIFEVQDGCLVWKQYFPTRKVYGKLGKFKLDLVDHEEAVKGCLAGVMDDIKNKSDCIIKIQKESEAMSKKLEKAMELATRSVKSKEDFEKEIYGKCAQIINAKKHRIVQLKSSNRPCPSPAINISEEVCAMEEREDSKRLVKKPRIDPNSSDGYSSDTDVDEPAGIIDLSSGDETPKSPLSKGSKRQDTQKKMTGKKCTPGNVDSQELFNDSLEVELYPLSTRNKDPIKNGTEKRIGKRPLPSEYISDSQPGPSKQKDKLNVSELESENSIISELF